MDSLVSRFWLRLIGYGRYVTNAAGLSLEDQSSGFDILVLVCSGAV